MATGDLHKEFHEDQSSSSRDMLTDRQRQTDRSTLPLYREGVTNVSIRNLCEHGLKINYLSKNCHNHSSCVCTRYADTASSSGDLLCSKFMTFIFCS